MKKYLMPGVQSERLMFREVHTTDYDTWLPFYLDPESTCYWEGLPDEPEDACREQFDRIFERYQMGLGGMNALILKENRLLVGMCGLLVQQVDGIQELEVGYSILPGYRKMGYATEAARACKLFAFNNQLTPSLISIIHTENLPSQRVALNNGMHKAKVTIYNGNPVNIYRVFP
jgi:RimJ/RimL family protein N-acetyltransferase